MKKTPFKVGLFTLILGTFLCVTVSTRTIEYGYGRVVNPRYVMGDDQEPFLLSLPGREALFNAIKDSPIAQYMNSDFLTEYPHIVRTKYLMDTMRQAPISKQARVYWNLFKNPRTYPLGMQTLVNSYITPKLPSEIVGGELKKYIASNTETVPLLGPIAVAQAATALGGLGGLHYYHQWPLRYMKALKDAYGKDNTKPLQLNDLTNIKSSVTFWNKVLESIGEAPVEIDQTWSSITQNLNNNNSEFVNKLLDAAIARLELMHGIWKYGPAGFYRKGEEVIGDTWDATKRGAQWLQNTAKDTYQGIKDTGKMAIDLGKRVIEY